MGIPAFYRFLVERYPKSVVDVVEEAPAVVNGVTAPLHLSGANPNGIEFDNLYLDMNAIIHPCFHPEGLPAPKTHGEVFKAVFEYVDRIFSVIRPRKLLFMAIDGVAPRAKMNQQRARRFRTAQDADDQIPGTEGSKWLNITGKEYSSPLGRTDAPDSNVITPGTEFMSLLSSALQYYICLRMNKDHGWKGIKVILSDASVPGEGEHKIMSYIRLQRNLPGFDPNTRHCLYGLDADLIMLALATHEYHFTVLRENARKAQSGDNKAIDTNITEFIMRQKFQFLHVWILKEYLAHELLIPDAKDVRSVERLIDDFVFMCMFVGNDFLPHVPSLDISEGAIDLLMTVYKKEFVQMGGYLTNGVEVNLKRVQHFIQAVGAYENSIFLKRSKVQKSRDLRYGHKKDRNGSISNDVNSLIDKVRLSEEGFKVRYYTEKFGAQTEEDRERARKQAVEKYIEGICWVMHYYYEGVCSWNWFYPFHYAPFASDLYDIDQIKIGFTLGKPFNPFSQLMAVLPPASAHALPLVYRKLMTDPSSPISDFYPIDFELDMNGKHQSWQAICKLPFIEESRLLQETEKLEHTLSDAERKRNKFGMDILFVHQLNPLATKIILFYERHRGHSKLACAKLKRKINPNASGGMNGYMYISEKQVRPLEITSPIDGMEVIKENQVLSVFYKCPSSHSHDLQLPEGVLKPRKIINKRDIQPPPILWHEKSSVMIGRVDLKRPIPNCVSGSFLAKCAHRLVLQQYPTVGSRLGMKKVYLNKTKAGVVNLDDKKCKSDDKVNQPVSEEEKEPVSKEEKEPVSEEEKEPVSKEEKEPVSNGLRDKAKDNGDGIEEGQEKVEPSLVIESVVSLDENKNEPEDGIKPVSIDLGDKAKDNADGIKKGREKVEPSLVIESAVILDENKNEPEDGIKPVSIGLGDKAKDNADGIEKGQEKVEPNLVIESVVSLDENKSKPEDGIKPVSNGLRNKAKDNADGIEKGQEKVEPSLVIESVVSLDEDKYKPEDEIQPVSNGLLSKVSETHHDEHIKKKRKRKIRTVNENLDGDSNQVTSKVSETHHDEHIKKKRKRKIQAVNENLDGDSNQVTKMENVELNQVGDSKCKDGNSDPNQKKRKRRRNKRTKDVNEKLDGDSDQVAKMENVEPNQVGDNKCKDANSDPNQRSPKRRRRRRTKNVNGELDGDSDQVTMMENVEPNQVGDNKCKGANSDPNQRSPKRRRRRRTKNVNGELDGDSDQVTMMENVEPNQVGDRICKSSLDEPVSIEVLNVVNESCHYDTNQRSLKRRKKNHGKSGCDDKKVEQYQVSEPEHNNMECNDDIVVGETNKRKRNEIV